MQIKLYLCVVVVVVVVVVSRDLCNDRVVFHKIKTCLKQLYV